MASAPLLQNNSGSNLTQGAAYLNSLPERDISVVVLPQHESRINSQIALPILDLYVEKNIHMLTGFDVHLNPKEIPEQLLRSPIRFTWEYDPTSAYPKKSLSDFQHAACSDLPTVVVLASWEGQLRSASYYLPHHYVEKKTFALQDEMFKYQTIMSVYQTQCKT